jgi:adenine-specific DNA-methyltransferase
MAWLVTSGHCVADRDAHISVFVRIDLFTRTAAPHDVTKGFVPTPAKTVDLMIDKLFRSRPLTPDSTVLDAGCGDGEFIDGVSRWCSVRGLPLPTIVGIEADAKRAQAAAMRFAGTDRVHILHQDFLRSSDLRFDFVVGNPPYVPITGLGVAERDAYRCRYATAKGRFDLYLLFFEQAMELLKPGGTLVFITPEKFIYVDTARPLRDLLLRARVEELHFLGEDTFSGLITYPLVTTVSALAPTRSTQVILRSGTTTEIRLDGGASWLPSILGHRHAPSQFTLSDTCVRVSCGVATGADSVFVMRDDKIPSSLAPFARPTISGRQIDEMVPLRTRSSILVPYDGSGRLLPEDQLEALGPFLAEPGRRARLLARTCVAHKPWYAFHENPPMREMLKPKLICKDITSTPFFVVDRTGDIVPRHSTYYVVPLDSVDLDELAEHVNSASSRDWLRANCQRAANGFLRLQSQVLKRLPVPANLVPPQVLDEQLAFDAEALPA